MLSLQADDIFVQLGAVALSLTLSGVGSRVFSCTLDILKSNCIDPKLCKIKWYAMMTHHDNEKQTLILHIHYIQIFVWEKSLFCTFTVTKLASDYLLAAYHMFLMFVIHLRKTRHLKQLSGLSIEVGIYNVAKLQVLLWRLGFQSQGTMLVLNECAVGWITISVA